MRYRIRQQIYPVAIFLCLDTKQLGKDNDGLCIKYEDNSIEIHIRSFQSYEKTISILIHELSHLLDFTEDIIGSQLSSEGRSYLAQFLSLQMLQKLQRYHKRKYGINTCERKTRGDINENNSNQSSQEICRKINQ